MLASIFLSFFFLFQTSAVLTSPTPQPSPSPSPRVATEEPPSVTRHSVRVGGRQLNYSVTTGFMPIKNAQNGETEARIFYMAYTLDGVADKARRPLMFSF